MTEIYSKIEPTKLLHIIVRQQDIPQGRKDLCPADQFLQCASLRFPQGKTFKPHRHIWKHGEENVIAQESWICIRGNVEVTLYDLDDSVLHKDIIGPGELSISFESGHNYEILSDDAQIFEYKTGPYSGVENDKILI